MPGADRASAAASVSSRDDRSRCSETQPMNLALWLERAGRKTPQRPALGLRRARAAQLRRDAPAASRGSPARCAAMRPRARRPRRHRGEELPRLSRSCSTRIWHAGLAAVPANAKLHGAELGYILEHSGARVCFASAGARRRDRAACAANARAADRRSAAPTTSALFAADADRRSRRAPATISPGCSTPRAPPAGRRARC